MAKSKKDAPDIPKWLLSTTEMGKSLGVSYQTFKQWGVPHREEKRVGRGNATRKYYACADVVNNRVKAALAEAQRRGQLSGLEDSDIKKEMEAAKLEQIRERTEELAIKNAIARREYAPINAIEHALGQVGAQISATLESIPLKLKRRFPKLGAAELEIIKEEIIKCQNLAADIQIDWDGFDESE